MSHRYCREGSYLGALKTTFVLTNGRTNNSNMNFLQFSSDQCRHIFFLNNMIFCKKIHQNFWHKKIGKLVTLHNQNNRYRSHHYLDNNSKEHFKIWIANFRIWNASSRARRTARRAAKIRSTRHVALARGWVRSDTATLRMRCISRLGWGKEVTVFDAQWV